MDINQVLIRMGDRISAQEKKAQDAFGKLKSLRQEYSALFELVKKAKVNDVSNRS